MDGWGVTNLILGNPFVYMKCISLNWGMYH